MQKKKIILQIHSQKDPCRLHIWKISNRHVFSSKVNVNICMQKRSQVLAFFFKRRTVYKEFPVSDESFHLYRERSTIIALEYKLIIPWISEEDWISRDVRKKRGACCQHFNFFIWNLETLCWSLDHSIKQILIADIFLFHLCDNSERVCLLSRVLTKYSFWRKI